MGGKDKDNAETLRDAELRRELVKESTAVTRSKKKGQPGMAVPREGGQLICGRANQWKWLNDLKTEKRRRAGALQKLLFGGGGFGSGVGVLFGETLDAASGVNQLLLAGEEGMAVRANFHAQHVALDG